MLQGHGKFLRQPKCVPPRSGIRATVPQALDRSRRFVDILDGTWSLEWSNFCRGLEPFVKFSLQMTHDQSNNAFHWHGCRDSQGTVRASGVSGILLLMIIVGQDAKFSSFESHLDRTTKQSNKKKFFNFSTQEPLYNGNM